MTTKIFILTWSCGDCKIADTVHIPNKDYIHKATSSVEFLHRLKMVWIAGIIWFHGTGCILELSSQIFRTSGPTFWSSTFTYVCAYASIQMYHRMKCGTNVEQEKLQLTNNDKTIKHNIYFLFLHFKNEWWLLFQICGGCGKPCICIMMFAIAFIWSMHLLILYEIVVLVWFKLR